MIGPIVAPITTGLILVIVLAAFVSRAAGPASAQGTAGPCTDATGVTVVVDFQSLDRDTIIRCASQPVASGFDALTRAGISVTAVSTISGVVCHLDGLPAEDPCASMPATDFYWSYWNAEPGGEWAYAQVGAAARRPEPGSVEGWSFVTDGAQSRTTEPRPAPPAPATEGDQGQGANTPALPVVDPDGPAPPEPAAPASQVPAPAAPQSGASASGQSQPAAATAADPDAQPDVQSRPAQDDGADDDAADDDAADEDAADDDSSAPVGQAAGDSGPTDDAGDGNQDDSGDTDQEEGPRSPDPSPSAFDAAEPLVRPTPLDQDEVALGGGGSAAEADAVLAAGGSTQGILTDDGSPDGPPPSTLAGLGLVLVLGTSAGLVAHRRREQNT